jgi:bifunctional non-homologous end joining protein LigD
MLWDQGTWQPENDDVSKALAKGDLKFTLDGYKLKGSWVLVRTRGYNRQSKQPHEAFGGGDGKSWLLIKHRDEWSSGELDILSFAPLSVKSEKDFPEILAADNPDLWRTNRRVEGGETGAMLREIIEKAAALKHARASAGKSSRPSPAKRKTAAAAPLPGRRRPSARGRRAR